MRIAFLTMEYHTKVFLILTTFILTVGVTLPLASITSMRFVLQRDCSNPNYVPRNPVKHAQFCEQLGW